MSDQYVFELQFKGKADGSDYRENQFVIIDGSSMADFTKLKEDLALCMPEPFTVQYIDDEDDTISIDTEEEFQEFSKIAKKRSSRGMLMRLILNSTLPLDHGQFPSPSSHSGGARSSTIHSPLTPKTKRTHQVKLSELKERIKAELKNEILNELREKGPTAHNILAPTNNINVETAAGSSKASGRVEEENKETEYEEDSDGNMFLLYLPEKNSRKSKLMHFQKKLEKKEAVKIDQRLEKLEMKRKKLMEKYNHHKVLVRKPLVDPKLPLPAIFSAIAFQEPSETFKCACLIPAKEFTHVWTIINDGTVPLNNVELRHMWSSPGLEPEETAVKLPHLLPSQDTTVAIRFKAPRTPGVSVISYWNFVRLVDARWQEFGHYVSLNGTVKAARPASSDLAPANVAESNKKAKPKSKPDQKSVSFSEVMDTASVAGGAPKESAQKEEKVMNDESMCNITLKKQMEQLQATLVSGEIAAEMAREAARLLAKAAENNTASPTHSVPKSSEGEKLNPHSALGVMADCALEEAAAGVQQLNLVDSESDTDANMETNEDPDRGFVMVTMDQTTEEPDKHVKIEDNKDNKENNKTAAPSADNKKDEAQAQPEPFPRLDPNVTYPVFPPAPPRVTSAPVFLSHSPMLPNNVYNYPVFPPPLNYTQTPTYPPMMPPVTVPVPLPNPPAFVSQPLPQPLASQPSQNMAHIPFTPCPVRTPPAWNTVVFKPPVLAENPFGTGAPESNTAVLTETFATGTTAETPRPEPQHQTQSQPQPQPQTQQKQPTEANPTTDEQSKKSEPVQILPQALVDGAINVAATAYSTAWNTWNNLRTKEGEASEFDPVFENNMAVLVEMGFNNLERNGRLLKRFNNDISQVIGVICATGGSAHNLDID